MYFVAQMGEKIIKHAKMFKYFQNVPLVVYLVATGGKLFEINT